MNYKKILHTQIVAKEAFDEGWITPMQYSNILNNLEHDLLQLDVEMTNEDFNTLIERYT
jgi:hypothetical protein